MIITIMGARDEQAEVNKITNKIINFLAADYEIYKNTDYVKKQGITSLILERAEVLK